MCIKSLNKISNIWIFLDGALNVSKRVKLLRSESSNKHKISLD